MVNLIRDKLEAVNKLKDFTIEILHTSPKDDDRISSMIEKRQKYMDSINLINEEIENHSKYNSDKYLETEEIKMLNNEIKSSIQEIINLDKEIRKNISYELKNIKTKLNQPETSFRSVNIKI